MKRVEWEVSGHSRQWGRFGAALLNKLRTRRLLILAASTCLITSGFAQSLFVNGNPVCVGDQVTVTVVPSCDTSEGWASAQVGGDSVTLVRNPNNNNWIGLYTPSSAGEKDGTAQDSCDDDFDPCTLTVVQVERIDVSGATAIDEINFAAVKTTNANDYVTATATLVPDTSTAATLFSWSGGDAVPANPLQHRVSKNTSAETTMTASGCDFLQSVDVWIVWSSFTRFNNSGPKDTDSSVEPPTFGTSHPIHNGTLMQITMTPAGFGQFTDVPYDIKRSKERGNWSKSGGTWQQYDHVGPGADDDTVNTDEDLVPSSSDRIYVADWPGFGSSTAFADEAVYKGSFVEWNTIDLDGWTKCSDDYPWHSITWVTNSGTTWQRKTGAINEISTGPTTVGTGSTP